MTRITIWNEFRHERSHDAVKEIYPDGIHAELAKALSGPGREIATATLDEPENGLPQSVLDSTDVLLWWGHMAHKEVADQTVDRVQQRVLDGMGLMVLHSGHYSRPFQRLMGTGCGLSWREIGERERLWVVDPGHPIAAGLPKYIEVEHAEMYGEHFDVPAPDELVFVSWFQGGEVFRSGMVWKRGRGKVFYFRPGHETYPIYKQAEIIKVLSNAIDYVRFAGNTETTGIGSAPNMPEPIEKIT